MNSTESEPAVSRPDLPRRGSLRAHLSGADDHAEQGSAIIEFLALGTLLLIPTVWFLLAVAEVQAASYAAVGAADQAAKMYTAGDADPGERSARSEAAVSAALADFGISPDQGEFSRTCSADCEIEGSLVGYTVQIHVPVPLIPELPGLEHRLVSVSSTSTQIQGD